jgi:hypothetical protein
MPQQNRENKMTMLVAAPWQKPPALDLEALSAGVKDVQNDMQNDAQDDAVSILAKPEAAPTVAVRLPAPLRNLWNAVTRAFLDVDAAGRAQKSTARLLSQAATAAADGRPVAAADLGPARALATVTETKMHNGLAALNAVMANPPPPPELHRPMVDILMDSRRQFEDALHTRDGGPEVSGLARNIALSAPVNRSAGSKSDSMNVFFGDLGEAIASLKTDYLGVYETAMEKNSAFYKEFLDATDLTKWMEASDKEVTLTLTTKSETRLRTTAELDKRMTEFQDEATAAAKKGAIAAAEFWRPWSGYSQADIRDWFANEKISGAIDKTVGLLSGLKELLKKFAPAGNGVLDHFKDENGTSYYKERFDPLTDDQKNGILVFAKDEASAKKWAKDMGLSESVVSENPEPDPKADERWLVKLDLKPIQNMVESLEEIVKNAVAKADAKGTIKVILKTAQFQAWKVGFEAQATEIKNTSTVLAQKMANAQSIYENLIKVLSGTINSIMEMLKAFLQI